MENGSIRIATVGGIPIRTHFTVLLALPLVALGFANAFSAAAEIADVPPGAVVGSPWVWGFGVAVALFVSVLLHELAHSLYAVRTGGAVREITLLMIGGVSHLSRPPRSPGHEAMMALVGPLLSLGLGVTLYGLSRLIGSEAFTLRFALFYLGTLNMFLGLFNLLPAFPMDGGRILRALLVNKLGILQATEVAAVVGKGFAIAFGFLGIVSMNVFLMLIAFFVWMGADGEYRAENERSLLGKLKVRDVMNREAVLVMPAATLREVADQMSRERRVGFVLTPDGNPVGVLTAETIRRVPPDRREKVTAREVAQMVPVVAPSDDLTSVLRMMGQGEVAVMDEAGFVGVVSREDLARVLRYMELEVRPPRVPPPGWQQRPLGH